MAAVGANAYLSVPVSIAVSHSRGVLINIHQIDCTLTAEIYNSLFVGSIKELSTYYL